LQAEKLERRLGLKFTKPSLLSEALTHPSFLNENPHLALPSYQRLEFLGDAVLGVMVALELFQRFPDMSEGELTQLRSELVQTQSLAELASNLELGEYLDMGKGEEANGGRSRPSNLEDALEALVGATYLDQGPAVTRTMVLGWMEERLQRLDAPRDARHPKSRLQEILQAEKGEPPRYRVVDVRGPDHGPTYTIEVMGGDQVMGTGTGASKSEAERDAAVQALETLTNA